MDLDRGVVPSIQERLARPHGMPFQPEFSSAIYHVRSRADYLGERWVLARGMSRMGTTADLAAQRAQIEMNLRYGDPWELLELRENKKVQVSGTLSLYRNEFEIIVDRVKGLG